jgi:TolB-like protein
MQTTSPKIKPIVSIIILVMMVFCYQAATADVAPQVKTDKDNYSAGETIRVNYFNAPGNQRDWLCIVASGSPDNEAGDYKYMPDRVSEGVLTFNAPIPGKYEVRAYYNYSRNGYVVSARYSFSVVDMASPAKLVTSVEKIKPVEGPAVMAFPAGTTRINVSVFHFIPLSMDATNYGITVTNTLSNAPKMQSSFTMLDRKDLEIFLAANSLQQSDQIENIVEIGTRLGLNFVIAGNIEKRGTMIVTKCKVVSIDQRKVVFTDQSISIGEGDLIRRIMKMSDAIIAAILSNSN